MNTLNQTGLKAVVNSMSIFDDQFVTCELALQNNGCDSRIIVECEQMPSLNGIHIDRIAWADQPDVQFDRYDLVPIVMDAIIQELAAIRELAA